LSQDDVIRGSAIQSIMCNGELDFEQLAQRFDLESEDYFAEEIRALRVLQQDGMVEFLPTGVRATSRGRLLLRIIAMCFDRYLPSFPHAAPLSRVV
jgi:oxygen-independent coproporphyrinogen-3 oxidase